MYTNTQSPILQMLSVPCRIYRKRNPLSRLGWGILSGNLIFKWALILIMLSSNDIEHINNEFLRPLLKINLSDEFSFQFWSFWINQHNIFFLLSCNSISATYTSRVMYACGVTIYLLVSDAIPALRVSRVIMLTATMRQQCLTAIEIKSATI